MPGENLTRDEARERAALVAVESYDVALDLRSALGEVTGDGPRTFRSVTTIRFAGLRPGAATFVDLIAPSVSAVTLNGRALDVAEVFDGTRIALEGLEAENTLVVDAQCAYSRTGEGMHRFVDPQDGEVYLYTQYEPADSRRVYANFEQPDLKGRYRFSVTAPEGWGVWSNGAGERDADGVWRFAETEPISTYITCVVAGPYHYVTDDYRRTLPDGSELRIPLGAMCRKGLAPHFDADDIFLVTKQGLDFFHDHFGYPYPFGKYDQAFVPEYNLGAMENPGMVTFREEYIYRGKVTAASYERRATTILHEMAHMWFGDLVTMKWWDDLWLKESFADFMGSFALVEATRFTNGWTTFANNRKAWAYRADQLPSTHPITADIRDLQDAKLNFDGITYAKGASVLKQLVAYVGEDAFFAGVQAYFKQHAFGNTKLTDLLGALEKTSGRDLTTWAQKWLQTAGINVLRPEITTDADGTVTSFAVRQTAPALPAGAKGTAVLRPHRIAIGSYDLDDAGRLVRTGRIELDVDGELTEVPELVGTGRPAVFLLNDDDLSYAKVRLDEDSLAVVTAHLGDFAESLPRALSWASAWDMTRDGELATRDYLDLVISGIPKESDIGVVQSLQRQVHMAIEQYADPAWRPEGLARWTEFALEQLRAAAPGSDHQLAWARAFADTARTDTQLDLLEALLDGGETIEGLAVDTELRWALLHRLAATGRADEGAVDAELARDRTAAGERHAASARSARPTEEAKATAWASVVESDKLANAVQEAVIGGFVQYDQRELLAPYTAKYFAAVKDVAAGRSHEMVQQIVVGLYPALQISQETLDATDAWIAANDPTPGLRRMITECRAGVERALRAREADAAAGRA
ncbi:aminopeptidase N [Streptomyces wadayamensis]|uniref:Aminopeptidase N n=2 Tax=Streptomyces TaxID=1883 RepID=A0ABR4S4H8_9ACTN|nr:aminopeptidase N [Streptomyces wadayamensis]KDR60115.1 aminopeptidase N [Streptomyces wadayamensis]